MNKQKGITLIALVITIIVLLILAGVAISTLAGNDNILNNAETAVEKYNEKAEAEEAVLNTLEKKLIEFSNGKGTSTDTPQLTLQEDLEKNPENYRNSAQSASNTDIAVAENGDKVNLDSWRYQLKTNAETASLASTTPAGEAYYELVGESNDGSYTANPSYKGTTDNGAITEKVPAYIRDSSTGKVYPVTKLVGTFSGLNITVAPEIPSTVTEIGEMCFNKCSELTTITIPSSVTTIGNWAFSSCDKLSSINISSGVTTIGEGAFAYNEKLTTITIPSSVTTMGAEVFNGWTATQRIDYAGTVAPDTWNSNWKAYCNAQVYFNGVPQD